jgi:ribA/ribD-fused uncharacterized protein
MKEYFTKNGFSLFWGGPYSQWETWYFTFNNITFNCNEQMMMYCKALVCGDKETAELIMEELFPDKQKKLGRKVKNFSEELWNYETSMAVVYVANYCKFTQNPEIKEYLLNDPGTEIVEASPYDVIWGIGLGADKPQAWHKNSWRGENRLGECITDVRKYILDEINDDNRLYHDACIEIVKRILK